MMDNCHMLLTILQSHAPSSYCQNITAIKYNEIKASMSESEAEKTLTIMLYDGLMYGNWPWENI